MAVNVLIVLATAVSEFMSWCSDVKYPGKVCGLVSGVHHKLNHFFLLQLNAYNMLNTRIYHQFPPTCFGLCYTTFRETVALLAQKLYASCNVAIKCTIYNFFFKFTMLLQCLQPYVNHM